ncbi:hypothetical protein D3OALGA1CA_2285 [Olavius algarvensis associated proteobacterium Delta 3]|nr:hypothetical protein D3OALGA1CA_2285 [Olavius algarvensis associated proteobacterium Delta 3]
MKLPILVLLILLTCTVATACEAVAEISPIEQLKWLESTSGAQSFQTDRDAGILRFYVTFGYARKIPGIGNVTHSRCYQGIKLIAIGGTTDTPMSEKHSRLIDLADSFAREYNLLMKQYIDSIGVGTCPPGADWEGMLASLTEFVWGSTQLEGMVGVVRSEMPRIMIDLKDLKRKDNVSSVACKTLQNYGIREPVIIEIYEWLPPPPPGYNSRKIDEFRCIQGHITR